MKTRIKKSLIFRVAFYYREFVASSCIYWLFSSYTIRDSNPGQID